MHALSIRYAESRDGTRIATGTAGSGVPLVVGPTPTSNMQAEWQSARLGQGIRQLARSFRVVRYDRRGAGHSNRGIHDYRLARRLEDLECVIDQLQLNRVVLVGQATSVPECVAYAVKHPDRVARLALLSPPADPAARERSPRYQFVWKSLKEDWETATMTLAGILGGWNDAAEMREHAEIIRNTVDQVGLAAFHAAGAAEDIAADACKLAMEVLVIHPRSHPFVPADAVADLTAAIPRGRLTIVDSGASPLLGEAADTIAALEAFAGEMLSPSGPDPEGTCTDGLTARELDVLRLVAAGLENSEIADRLFISGHTVARHITHIYAKTGTANRVQATRYAIDHHLTE
ncbi:MAG: alpha/beta fold hydrolase [Dehalococcoidia bacterium]|nr:alpha/beta fold hydrolase [Dehalococcoidia bacterium]